MLKRIDTEDLWDSLESASQRKLTWSAQPGKKHTDITRVLVISRLVSFNDRKIIEAARAEFRTNLAGSQTIPADFRGAIFRAVARCGDGREYEGLFELYGKSDLQEEKTRAFMTLGAAKDSGRFQRAIDCAILMKSETRMSCLSS